MEAQLAKLRVLVGADEHAPVAPNASANAGIDGGDLISPKEAAFEFGVDERTARRWATKPGIGVRMPGNRLFLRRSRVRCVSEMSDLSR
jgi:hypothetical protein